MAQSQEGKNRNHWTVSYSVTDYSCCDDQMFTQKLNVQRPQPLNVHFRLPVNALARVTRWEATFLQTQTDYIYSYLKGLQIFAV